MNKPRRLLWGLIIAYITAGLIGVSSILYANYAIMESNNKWCEVLAPLDEAYRSAPIQTDVGRRVAAAIHNRYVEYGCEGAQ